MNEGDEIFILMFDYLFWMVVVMLVGGKVVYYFCDEENEWFFDIEDIKVKISLCIKGILIINLNNLMGVVYSCVILLEIVELVC